ncbi:MAG: histidine kinase, partial [Candidatus Nanopelagicaceae bacterium]
MKLSQWSLRSRLTIGIVLLSAIGFMAIFFGTSAALKGYLVNQIDDQLKSVAGGTSVRLDRGAAIQRDSDVEIEEHHGNRNRAIPPQPLQRIPTTLSVTLLDPNGVIK